MSRNLLPSAILLCFSTALLAAAPQPAVTVDVDQLARDLASPVLPVRRNASEKLGRTGEPARAAVPALVKALSDDDDLVRRNAAWALGKIQQPHEIIVPALIAKLDVATEDWGMRHNVALSLSWIGRPAVPALTERLTSRLAWTRAYATDALLRIGHEDKAVDLARVVRGLLGDPDVGVRTFAASLTGRLGPQGAPLVLPLVALLDEPTVPPRLNAIKALQELGLAAKPALPRVKRALREDTDQWVRIGAAHVIAAAAADDPDLVRLLVGSFTDSTDRVGNYVVQIVAGLGAPAVPALLELLQSERPRLRIRAAETLAFMGAKGTGQQAPDVATALLPLVAQDSNWEVRSLAAAAIGALASDRPDIVAVLETALRDDHEIVRLNAGDALKKLGHILPASPAATPAIVAPGADTAPAPRRRT